MKELPFAGCIHWPFATQLHRIASPCSSFRRSVNYALKFFDQRGHDNVGNQQQCPRSSQF
jgi:hypothetical protein